MSNSLIKEIDSLIRTTNYLKNLLKRNSGVEYDLDSLLNNILPDIVQVRTDKFDYLIATYMLFDHSTLGPRLAIMKNNLIFPMTGQCSTKYLYSFKFNGKHYIQTGSNCCDCGITGEQIFEVDESKIKTVYEDYSFSD